MQAVETERLVRDDRAPASGRKRRVEPAAADQPAARLAEGVQPIDVAAPEPLHVPDEQTALAAADVQYRTGRMARIEAEEVQLKLRRIGFAKYLWREHASPSRGDHRAEPALMSEDRFLCAGTACEPIGEIIDER